MTPRVYSIDGRKVTSVRGFYREIGRSVNGPGGYFGGNLDALADCLRGGFGTPTDQPFEFLWEHSGTSRRHLDGRGPTSAAFVDAVRGVFDDVGVSLRLA